MTVTMVLLGDHMECIVYTSNTTLYKHLLKAVTNQPYGILAHYNSCYPTNACVSTVHVCLYCTHVSTAHVCLLYTHAYHSLFSQILYRKKHLLRATTYAE